VSARGEKGKQVEKTASAKQFTFLSSGKKISRLMKGLMKCLRRGGMRFISLIHAVTGGFHSSILHSLLLDELYIKSE